MARLCLTVPVGIQSDHGDATFRVCMTIRALLGIVPGKSTGGVRSLPGPIDPDSAVASFTTPGRQTTMKVRIAFFADRNARCGLI